MCFHIKTCFKNRSPTPFFQHGPLSRTRFSLMLVSFFTRRARDNNSRTVFVSRYDSRMHSDPLPSVGPLDLKIWHCFSVYRKRYIKNDAADQSPAFNFAHHTINHALPPNTPLTPFCVGPTVTKARTQLSDSLMAIRWLCLSNVQW